MVDNNELIDTFIACQRRAVRWQLGLAILFVVTGIACLLIGNLLSGQIESVSSRSTLLSIGGVLSAGLSAFPVKDLLARREKTDALQFLKQRLLAARAGNAQDADEVAQVNATLWKTLNAIIER